MTTANKSAAKHGDWMDQGPYISDMDFSNMALRVATNRYHDPDYHLREREDLWLKSWRIVGRTDDLPEVGDWLEYRLFDQSWLVVRGKDNRVRGFVNACRHRGNRLCTGRGRAARFNCRYHNWMYALDGSLVAVAKPDFAGDLESFVGDKAELGLIEVPLECFAGFLFLNPDPKAAPLAEFLGEAAAALAPYHLEEMVPVALNVRETLECNWKVVMDAFGEGYHVQGVHPALVGIVDMRKERFRPFGLHCASTVPFGTAGADEADAEQQVKSYLQVPTVNFPNFADALPRFAAKVDSYRNGQGQLTLPPEVTPRTLLQQAMREALTARGLDVSGLTDSQMIDYQYWLFFPNVFIQVCAGECTLIIAEPHPDGDPNRSQWQVMYLQWLPPQQRQAARTAKTQVREGEHYPYNEPLEQDYEQMALQQSGLRNAGLPFQTLTRQEPRLAHFHAALDNWLTASHSPAAH